MLIVQPYHAILACTVSTILTTGIHFSQFQVDPRPNNGQIIPNKLAITTSRIILSIHVYSLCYSRKVVGTYRK